MKFIDFSNDELIGKEVLISSRYSAAIRTIDKVGKKTFTASNGSKFSLLSGYLVGGGKWDITTAKLLTQDEATNIRKKWADKKLANEAIQTIENNLKQLSLPILLQMVELIPKTTNHETNT